MVSDGNGVSQMSGNVPVIIKQTMDVVSDTTGVDMSEIMEKTTLENAVKRTAGMKENNPPKQLNEKNSHCESFFVIKYQSINKIWKIT